MMPHFSCEGRRLRALICAAAVTVALLAAAEAHAGWQYQDSQLYNSVLGVAFPTASTGWVVGAGQHIYRTTDGGSTWTTQTTDLSPYSGLYSVAFVSANTGWAVGGSGAILHTDDAGQNWTRQSSPEVAILSSVSFPTARDGWIVAGGAGNMTLRTTDGGEHWTEVPLPDTASGMWTGHFISASTGWVIGSKGRIYRTQNAGSNWTQLNAQTTADLGSVWFVDGSNGWICGASGLMLRTSNSGMTWSRQNTGVSAGLNAVRFIDTTHGWAVGNSGTIITTSDGGAHWTKHYTGTTSGFNAIGVPDAAHACAAGSYGLLYLQTPKLKTTMYRWPVSSSLSFKRKKGVARFTLWGRVAVGKYYAPLVHVHLQESTTGRKWRTVASRTSDSQGWANKTFAVKSKRTRYYRWSVPGTVDYSGASTGKQKVVVK
jgi:photosystem II stability/assembly factor-like uncharacterized protein